MSLAAMCVLPGSHSIYSGRQSIHFGVYSSTGRDWLVTQEAHHSRRKVGHNHRTFYLLIFSCCDGNEKPQAFLVVLGRVECRAGSFDDFLIWSLFQRSTRYLSSFPSTYSSIHMCSQYTSNRWAFRLSYTTHHYGRTLQVLSVDTFFGESFQTQIDVPHDNLCGPGGSFHPCFKYHSDGHPCVTAVLLSERSSFDLRPTQVHMDCAKR